jgi:hypothetical protein
VWMVRFGFAAMLAAYGLWFRNRMHYPGATYQRRHGPLGPEPAAIRPL